MLKSRLKVTQFYQKKVKNSKPWFGLQCQKARKKYQTARKNNNIQNSIVSKRIMINTSKKYKATVKKYYSKHIAALQNKIRKLRTEKPKDYLKLINSINKKTENISVEINDMFEYFKTLNV